MDLNKTKSKAVIYFKNVCLQFLGCLLSGVAVKIFSAPNHIAPGGATGVATMLNYLFNTPIGSVTLLINIPLLIFSYYRLDKLMTLKTLQVLIINLTVVDFLLSKPPVYHGDPMLACIFGGVLNGAGIALVLMSGGTGGGSDIINKLLHRKYPYMSTGQLMVMINGTIISCAALVYGQIEASLYGLVMTFAGSKITDALLYGSDIGKHCTIVTTKPEEIGDAITKNLKRSATMWDATGAYRHDERWVLMCVVRKQEFALLKQLVRSLDPKAFIVVDEARQIIGAGFKSTEL